MTISYAEMVARNFGTNHDFLRCLSLVQSLCKGRNAHWEPRGLMTGNSQLPFYQNVHYLFLLKLWHFPFFKFMQLDIGFKNKIKCSRFHA